MDFLRSLSDQELRLLVPNVVTHEFGSGETLVTEGETGDSMYIIRRGIVEVIGHTPEGRPMRVASMTRPHFIGESAITGEPRNATCRVQTDVEVLEVNREAFAELFKQHPEVVTHIGEVMANRALERKELLKDSHGDGVAARRNRFVAMVRQVFDI